MDIVLKLGKQITLGNWTQLLGTPGHTYSVISLSHRAICVGPISWHTMRLCKTPDYTLEGYSKNFGISENLSGLSLAILSGLELAFWTFWGFCPEYRNSLTRLSNLSGSWETASSEPKNRGDAPQIPNFASRQQDNKLGEERERKFIHHHPVPHPLPHSFFLAFSKVSLHPWIWQHRVFFPDTDPFLSLEDRKRINVVGYFFFPGALRIESGRKVPNWLTVPVSPGRKKNQSGANKNVDKIYQTEQVSNPHQQALINQSNCNVPLNYLIMSGWGM